ncbi:uroporphyrinogen decarboxylase family protein [Chloroflexota bacterium]
MSKSPAELFKEREKRINDAISLKIPDRVPMTPFLTFFPARYAGITSREAMYDYEKLAEASRKTIIDFEPDMYLDPFFLVAYGRLMELLGDARFKWPGGGLPDDSTFQFIDEERMKADEYDAFIDDPTDFILRNHIPRVLTALEPLKKLPYLPGRYYLAYESSVAVFGRPEVAGALRTLIEAGEEALKMQQWARRFAAEMNDLGFPGQFSSVAYAPFDYIGDFFRGTRGIMLDMYRNPDKLLTAMEKITPAIINTSLNAAKNSGINRCLITIHKGIDGFMSREQFQKFFWPGARDIITTLIDNDIVPFVLWEGDCTSRLDIIKDIPAGKAVYWFEQTDIFKAKEVLAGRVCIRGNVPATLLCTGSPPEVREYCKKLIDIVGKDGGLIIDGAIGIPDDARIENVREMVDFCREYGVYR